MMQNLLVERFKLAYHREKKEMQTYELVVAKAAENEGIGKPARSGRETGSNNRAQDDAEVSQCFLPAAHR